jgi:hypothetical protein
MEDWKRLESVSISALDSELLCVLGAPPRDWVVGQFDGRLHNDCADQLPREVRTRYNSKDPDKPKLTRSYLILNGERRAPLMANAPLPMRPGRSAKISENGHQVTLDLGWRTVEIKVGTQERQSWAAWKNCLSGKWKLGDPMFLHRKRKGGWFLRVTYTRPDVDSKPLEGRVMEVSFPDADDPTEMIKCVIRKGHKTIADLKRNRSLSAAGALAVVDRFAARRDKSEAVRRSINPRLQTEAYRSERDRSRRLSDRRQRVAQGWNHQWSITLARVAHQWRCASVMLFDLPPNLYGRSWPWAQFREMLKYKLGHIGIKLEICKSPKAEEVAQA